MSNTLDFLRVPPNEMARPETRSDDIRKSMARREPDDLADIIDRLGPREIAPPRRDLGLKALSAALAFIIVGGLVLLAVLPS